MKTLVEDLRSDVIMEIADGLKGLEYSDAEIKAAIMVDALIHAVRIEEENIKLDKNGQRVTIDEYLGSTVVDPNGAVIEIKPK